MVVRGEVLGGVGERLGEGYGVEKEEVFVRKGLKEEKGGNDELVRES